MQFKRGHAAAPPQVVQRFQFAVAEDWHFLRALLGIRADPLSGDPVDTVPVLVRSDTAELGLRFEQGRNFNATLTVFWLERDSELVYVGDAGTTGVNDATERVGFEGAVFWQATQWLAVNAAYNNTEARFKFDSGGGREIPGAAYRRGRAEFRLDAFNLFDADDNDIAYFYASRLPGEPAAGIEDLHFHPLEPRSIRAMVTWHWRR